MIKTGAGGPIDIGARGETMWGLVGDSGGLLSRFDQVRPAPEAGRECLFSKSFVVVLPRLAGLPHARVLSASPDDGSSGCPSKRPKHPTDNMSGMEGAQYLLFDGLDDVSEGARGGRTRALLRKRHQHLQRRGSGDVGPTRPTAPTWSPETTAF